MSSPGEDPDSDDSPPADDPDGIDSDPRPVPEERPRESHGHGPTERDGSAPEHSESGDAPHPEEWRREREPRRPPDTGTDDDEPNDWVLFAYDIASSIFAVALIGAYLFAVSGVWPPLVAVESGSMEPNMQVNDLVFVMDEERFPGDGAHSSGVVTAHAGERTGYTQFNGYGDVIVYAPDGNRQTVPIIHRAMFWVEEGENWCEQANPEYLGATTVDSDQCVADHSGFITKGDNNERYDQAQGLSSPVKPGWVIGTAQVRVPGLGWIRLQSAG